MSQSPDCRVFFFFTYLTAWIKSFRLQYADVSPICNPHSPLCNLSDLRALQTIITDGTLKNEGTYCSSVIWFSFRKKGQNQTSTNKNLNGLISHSYGYRTSQTNATISFFSSRSLALFFCSHILLYVAFVIE